MEMARTLVLCALIMAAFLGKYDGLGLCNINQEGLVACKPAVTKPNPIDPSADCCQALNGANLTCLCSYRSSPFLPALGIDPDLCMALPAKCDLQTPANC